MPLRHVLYTDNRGSLIKTNIRVLNQLIYIINLNDRKYDTLLEQQITG